MLVALTLLLSGCSASDWERNLRFGFPTGVTSQATRTRVLYTWSGVAALSVGVIVWGLIFWCLLRYPKKSEAIPRQTKYNFAIEMVTLAIPFVIISVLFWRTVVVENYIDHLSKNPDVNVQVDAFKWNWEFQYTHVRGQAASFTDYDGAQPSATRQSTSGQYLATVGSSNEVPILVIPANATVQIDEHSLDVIHSFWVPEFLFKRDVIPYGTTKTSRDNKFEFTATTLGSYVGRCAELCGTYHSQMNFEVRVVPMLTFESYLKALKTIGPDNPARQSLALKAVGLAPYATTTYPLDTVRTAQGATVRPGG